MEITQKQLPVTIPVRPMDDAGKTKYSMAVLQEAQSADSDEAAATRQALFNAARNLYSAQNARYQSYSVVASQAERAFGDGGSVEGNQLDALREALAGSVLSERIDGMRERAAAEFLDGQAWPEDDAGQSEQPVVALYAALDRPVRSVKNNDGNSLGDMWKQLAKMIDASQTGQLNDFAAALDKYTSLYQAAADILARFGQWVRSDSDNNMRVNFEAIGKALGALLDKYESPTPDQIIAGSAPRGGISWVQADAICERIGLDPAQCCRKNHGDGTYSVVPDMSQIKRMIEGLPATEKDFKISISSYNAWKAGFDSQMSRIEDSLQMRGQKYSNTFSRFENFHKTISAIIRSMADMLRQFLQF